MRIELERVQYMPKALEPGILYFAEEYGAAAHLCACGCGTKIRTPIAPTEWAIYEGTKGVTVRPSVGNWQHPCRSHYLITDGVIDWRDEWTEEEVLTGRKREAVRRAKYYESKEATQEDQGFFRRLWHRWFR